MGTAAILGYGTVTIPRSRRRTATFLASLSLAVATLSTPAIALDSEIRAFVDRLVESIPYDFHGVGRWGSLDSVVGSASSVDGVVGVEPFVAPESGTFFAGRMDPNGSGVGLTAVGIASARPSFARFADRFGLVGDFDVGPGEIAVTDRVAARAGLRTGDAATLWHPETMCVQEPFQCFPVNWTGTYRVGRVLATANAASSFRLPFGALWPRDTVFASVDTLFQMNDDLRLALDDPPKYAILVWADRSRLVDPYDPAESQSRVLHVRRLIESAIEPVEPIVVGEGTEPTTGTRLSHVVRLVADATAGHRTLFVLVSLPATALALTVTSINFQIGVARRRREVGVLRSRGWSARQVALSLLFEASLVGSLAALVGLLVGGLSAGIFLSLVDAGSTTGSASPFADVRFTPVAVAIVLFGGVGLALLVAVPAVRRATRLRIVRALQEIHPGEASVAYRDARSFLLIALGSAGLLGALWFAGISGEAGLLASLFGAGLAVLIVVAPMILLLGLARFVTLGTVAPYRAFARIVRPWTGDVHYLVAEGLQRQPRRSSNLAVLIAFGLAFAMFLASLVGVLEANELRAARTAVGGDLFFEAANVLREDLQDFETEPGVRALAVADFVPSNHGVVIGINASDYLAVVPWIDAYYFREGDPTAFASLPAGGAIANGRLADVLGLHVGDPIVVNVFSGRVLFSIVAQVTAIAQSLPGLQPSGRPADLERIVVVDIDRLIAAAGSPNYPLTGPGRRVLLRATDLASPAELARALETRWTGRSIVLDEVLSTLRTDPFRNSFFGLLLAQAGLSVVVLAAAVTLSTYASGVEREGEFATVAARGLGGRGLLALLFGEGISVSLVGSLVAIPTAFAFLWAFIRLEDPATPLSLALELYVPLSVWGLPPAALAAAAGGALLAAFRLRRMDLPALLKLRGM